MLKIALLGCGRIGRLHAHIVASNPGSRLAAVFDPVPEAAVAISNAHGVKTVDNAEAIFSDGEIDAVIVASATQTHSDFIEQAVRAGKPVLCEKPIDLDIERVRTCQAAIADSDVPIQIGFNRRFDPGHRELRDAVVKGEIGNLLQLIITSRDPAPPTYDYLRSAGGILRDMTIHDFDIARFVLAGDEPVEVFAAANALIDPSIASDPGDNDCTMVLMRSASGRQVLINNARQAKYGYDQRIEALGTEGMLQSSNRTPNGILRFGTNLTAGGTGYENFFIERYQEAFRLQWDAFLAAVSAGKTPEVGFNDGYEALRLAEAAYESLRSGRTVSLSGQ